MILITQLLSYTFFQSLFSKCMNFIQKGKTQMTVECHQTFYTNLMQLCTVPYLYVSYGKET